MIKKLVQYGGYLLSGILIAWLINPIAALAFLEIFLKMSLLIFIPIGGAYVLDKIILSKKMNFQLGINFIIFFVVMILKNNFKKNMNVN